MLPPGIDPKKNKPYGVRLYSIASTRYGPPPPEALSRPAAAAAAALSLPAGQPGEPSGLR